MTEDELFTAARRLAPPERAAYLAGACRADRRLRERVDRLLAADGETGTFLDLGLGIAFGPLAPGPAPGLTSACSDALAGTERGHPTAAGRPAIPERLGHFALRAVIGHGGFGVVYRAWDEVLLRTVAVKVLHPQLAMQPEFRKRFLREARAAGAVRHPNVVPVFAVEEEPQPFLVMDYIAGQNLQQRLDQVGTLDTDEAVSVVRQAAAGLGAAHAAGLVHRDVKPANILIEAATGRVVLADFGQVWAEDDTNLSQPGLTAGTPMYMSPEQTRGERPDHRGDLFSLGSVLYAAVAGRPPFAAGNSLAVIKRIAETDPDPLPDHTPAWLVAVVANLLAKDSARRPASAAELIAALDLRDAAPAPPPHTAPPPRTPARAAPRWLARALLGASLAAALFAVLSRPSDTRSPDEARTPGDPAPARPEPLVQVAPHPREVRALPPAADDPPLPADPDRVAAVWLLSHGGFAAVKFRAGGEEVALNTQDATKPNKLADRTGSLPPGPIEVFCVIVNRNTVVTNDACAALRGLRHLTFLQVSNCRVTDAVLAHFRHSTKLEEVKFHGTRLTDDGLQQLAQFPALVRVNVRQTQVTDLGVRQLSRALPKVVVEWNGGFVGPSEQGK